MRSLGRRLTTSMVASLRHCDSIAWRPWRANAANSLVACFLAGCRRVGEGSILQNRLILQASLYPKGEKITTAKGAELWNGKLGKPIYDKTTQPRGANASFWGVHKTFGCGATAHRPRLAPSATGRRR